MRKLLAGLFVLSIAFVPRVGRAEALLAYAKENTIYTASAADGKNARKICAGNDPCISNDGRFLVYTRNNAPAKKSKGADAGFGTRTLVLRELAGGKESLLPAGGAEQVYGGLWSPDDQWIAFNVLTVKSWQVGVVHPDGSAFHVLTGQLENGDGGYFLAGWNLHDSAVLAQNLTVLAQLDPVTGKAAWSRPVKELTGAESTSSSSRYAISPDGKQMISSREVEKDEFTNLDGPSSYLVLTELPTGPSRRVTPPKFDALNPCFEPGGETVLLRGFGQKDVTSIKGGDGVRLKTRIYRLGLREGKLTPLAEGGDYPSVSRE